MPEPVFESTTLELFVRLERMHTQSRNGPAFKVFERTLHRKLNLVDEWWRGCSVLDRSRASRQPHAHDDWHRVRAVRCALLEAGSKNKAAVMKRTPGSG